MKNIPHIDAPPLDVPGSTWTRGVLEHDTVGVTGRPRIWYGVTCYPAHHLPSRVATDLARNPGVWGADREVYVPWTSFANFIRPMFKYDLAGTNLEEVLYDSLPEGVFSTSGYGSHVLTGIIDDELFEIARDGYERSEVDRLRRYQVEDLVNRMKDEVRPLLESALAQPAPRKLRRRATVTIWSKELGGTPMPFSGYIVPDVGDGLFIYEFGDRHQFRSRSAQAEWHISHTQTDRRVVGYISTAADAARIAVMLHQRWPEWAEWSSLHSIPQEAREFSVVVEELYGDIVSKPANKERR